MPIAILEFGGQHTDLIGNRLQEMGYRVRYCPSNVSLSELHDVSGIILSGGPRSVYESDSFSYDPEIFQQRRIPVLGICYGMQLIAQESGGKVSRGGREYGETRLHLTRLHPLFTGFSNEETVWMNHGDSVDGNGNYVVLALTGKNVPAAIAASSGPYCGVQFHPEVTHTEKGRILLGNFARMTGEHPIVGEEFNAHKFIDDAMYELKQTIGNHKVFIGLSGGVDSTV